ANVHLDLACPNFGIQEGREFTQAEQDVFPGCPELKNGYFHANDRPGLGIDLNEQLAARFPVTDEPSFDMRWGDLRPRDGGGGKGGRGGGGGGRAWRGPVGGWPRRHYDGGVEAVA